MCMQCISLDPTNTVYDDHGVQSLDNVQTSYGGTGRSVPCVLRGRSRYRVRHSVYRRQGRRVS